MTNQEISNKIREMLVKNGIKPANSPYDDSGCLVSVYPEQRWVGCPEYAECLVCIFLDRVQKFQRATPFNFTTGQLIGKPEYYDTATQMVNAVKLFLQTPKASCWK